jgi:hypothetical protein
MLVPISPAPRVYVAVTVVPLTVDADIDPVPARKVQVAVVALPPIVPLSGMVTGSHTA